YYSHRLLVPAKNADSEYIDLGRGPGGRIDPAKGALGARCRQVIGEAMAQCAIASVLLPHRAMMWDIMSARPPASLPKLAG
ncbi:MAG TPA: hypothetical protein DDZ84_14050, partial [Firmicutes bacterium]|nr:hypothetical protein [Bacillota bacterium]